MMGFGIALELETKLLSQEKTEVLPLISLAQGGKSPVNTPQKNASKTTLSVVNYRSGSLVVGAKKNSF